MNEEQEVKIKTKIKKIIDTINFLGTQQEIDNRKFDLVEDLFQIIKSYPQAK